MFLVPKVWINYHPVSDIIICHNSQTTKYHTATHQQHQQHPRRQIVVLQHRDNF